MPAADPDVKRPPRLALHSELTQPGPHPQREVNGDLLQAPIKMGTVQLGMQPLKLGHDCRFSRPRAWWARPRRAGRRMVLSRKCEKDPARFEALEPTRPRTDKANDRRQHLVRRVRIAFVHPKPASGDPREHHLLIAVGVETGKWRQTESVKALN